MAVGFQFTIENLLPIDRLLGRLRTDGFQARDRKNGRWLVNGHPAPRIVRRRTIVCARMRRFILRFQFN